MFSCMPIENTPRSYSKIPMFFHFFNEDGKWSIRQTFKTWLILTHCAVLNYTFDHWLAELAGLPDLVSPWHHLVIHACSGSNGPEWGGLQTWQEGVSNGEGNHSIQRWAVNESSLLNVSRDEVFCCTKSSVYTVQWTCSKDHLLIKTTFYWSPNEYFSCYLTCI